MPFGNDAAFDGDDCDCDEHPVETATTRERTVTGSLTFTLPSRPETLNIRYTGAVGRLSWGQRLRSRDERRLGEARRRVLSAATAKADSATQIQPHTEHRAPRINESCRLAKRTTARNVIRCQPLFGRVIECIEDVGEEFDARGGTNRKCF